MGVTDIQLDGNLELVLLVSGYESIALHVVSVRGGAWEIVASEGCAH